MFLKYTKFIISTVMILVIFGIGFSVHAQGLGSAFKNANTVADTGGYKTDVSAESMIAKIISILLSILGVLFLLLMIWGGYLWMMARDNEQEVTRAKNLITAAVIGIIVVVSAYVISYFVVENVSKEILKSNSYIPPDP